jgi:hypothetical protein
MTLSHGERSRRLLVWTEGFDTPDLQDAKALLEAF